jgi:hypothetical protein
MPLSGSIGRVYSKRVGNQYVEASASDSHVVGFPRSEAAVVPALVVRLPMYVVVGAARAPGEHDRVVVVRVARATAEHEVRAAREPWLDRPRRAEGRPSCGSEQGGTGDREHDSARDDAGGDTPTTGTTSAGRPIRRQPRGRPVGAHGPVTSIVDNATASSGWLTARRRATQRARASASSEDATGAAPRAP